MANILYHSRLRRRYQMDVTVRLETMGFFRAMMVGKQKSENKHELVRWRVMNAKCSKALRLYGVFEKPSKKKNILTNTPDRSQESVCVQMESNRVLPDRDNFLPDAQSFNMGPDSLMRHELRKQHVFILEAFV